MDDRGKEFPIPHLLLLITDTAMTDDAGILKLIQAVEEADSAARLTDAVRSLAETRSTAAIPSLIKILGYNNPGAAVAAVDGLIEIGEPAVLPVIEQLDGYNYGARAWAIRALAGIGDVRGLEQLLAAAETDFALSVRRAAARGLGKIHWSQMPGDEIPQAQARVQKSLLLVSQDPEWVVRYSAVVGLQGLASAAPTPRPTWFAQMLTRLQEMAKTDPQLAVRARAQLAFQKLKAGTQLDSPKYGNL